MNGTPLASPPSTPRDPARPQAIPVENRVAAYLHLLGYGRFDQKDPKAAGENFMRAYGDYRAQYDIPADKNINDVARMMQAEVASDPEAVKRMGDLAAANGGKPGVYEVNVLQIGLRAGGAPLAVTGSMDNATRTALTRVQEREGQQNPAASAPAASTAQRSVARDPQVMEAQAYLRVLGYNGDADKTNTGPIDGIKGPLTTKALEQFAANNKLPKDAPMGEIIAALKVKALDGPGLARMEDILGKPVSTARGAQDIKAVQAVLRANGAQIGVTGKPDANGNDMAALNVLKAKQPTGPAAAPATPSQTSFAPADVVARPAQPQIVVAPGSETEGVPVTDPNQVAAVVIAEPAPVSMPAAPVSTPVPEAAPVAATQAPVATDMGEATIFQDGGSAAASVGVDGERVGPVISSTFESAAAPAPAQPQPAAQPAQPQPAAAPAEPARPMTRQEQAASAREARQTQGEVNRIAQNLARGNAAGAINAAIPAITRRLFK